MRIFISGPSGVGKSTIIKGILKKSPEISLSVSYTTRPQRKGEADGVDYFFVNEQSFKEMINKGAFLEWAHVHNHFYGTSLERITSKEQEGMNILFDIDVQGVKQAKEKGSLGCFIFIVPPNLDVLAKRLFDRGTEDPQAMRLRLENAKKELKCWAMYDFIVINDSLDKAINNIFTIIEAHKSSKEVVIGELPWLKTIV